MNIELRALADIKPYEDNPRINEAAAKTVARSIREFGFRQPIVVEKAGVIAAGGRALLAHGRTDAARSYIDTFYSPDRDVGERGASGGHPLPRSRSGTTNDKEVKP